MAIDALRYRSYLLRAYSEKIFPTAHDPYAAGPEQYAAVVRIEDASPSGGPPRPYTAGTKASRQDAIAGAFAWAKRIIDGKEHPQQPGATQ